MGYIKSHVVNGLEKGAGILEFFEGANCRLTEFELCWSEIRRGRRWSWCAGS